MRGKIDNDKLKQIYPTATSIDAIAAAFPGVEWFRIRTRADRLGLHLQAVCLQHLTDPADRLPEMSAADVHHYMTQKYFPPCCVCQEPTPREDWNRQMGLCLACFTAPPEPERRKAHRKQYQKGGNNG